MAAHQAKVLLQVIQTTMKLLDSRDRTAVKLLQLEEKTGQGEENRTMYAMHRMHQQVKRELRRKTKPEPRSERSCAENASPHAQPLETPRSSASSAVKEAPRSERSCAERASPHAQPLETPRSSASSAVKKDCAPAVKKDCAEKKPRKRPLSSVEVPFPLPPLTPEMAETIRQLKAGTWKPPAQPTEDIAIVPPPKAKPDKEMSPSATSPASAAPASQAAH
jgi:hypothetical protein